VLTVRTAAFPLLLLLAAIGLAAWMPPGLGPWRTTEFATLPFEGHGRPVAALSLTPDGLSAISQGDDGTERRWNLQRGTLDAVHPPPGPPPFPQHPAVTDPRTGSTAHAVGRRITLTAADGSHRDLPELPGEALGALAFDAAGGGIWAVDLQGTLWRVRSAGGEVVETHRRREGLFTAWAVDAEGNTAAGAADGSVRYWPAQPAASPWLFGAIPLAIAVAPDGRTLAVSHGSGIHRTGIVRLFQVFRKGPLEMSGARVEESFTATCLAFGEGGREVGGWHPLGATRSWNLEDGTVREGPPADGPARCPPPHDRRFTVTVWGQAEGPETLLEDTRTGAVVEFSGAYRRAADLPRTAMDRILSRFPYVAVGRDFRLAVVVSQPRWPLIPLEIVAVVILLAPGLWRVRNARNPRAPLPPGDR
jgi:hypothetical protein